jgi:hypothetical protein
MSKKKILYLLLAVASIAIILALLLSLNAPTGSGTQNPPANSGKPEEPIFVIPENPLGTIGLLSALAVAFGIFALKHKAARKGTL